MIVIIGKKSLLEDSSINFVNVVTSVQSALTQSWLVSGQSQVPKGFAIWLQSPVNSALAPETRKMPSIANFKADMADRL